MELPSSPLCRFYLPLLPSQDTQFSPGPDNKMVATCKLPPPHPFWKSSGNVPSDRLLVESLRCVKIFWIPSVNTRKPLVYIFHLLHVCTHTSTCVHATTHTWRSEVNLQESFFSFYTCFRDQTHGSGLAASLTSHIADSVRILQKYIDTLEFRLNMFHQRGGPAKIFESR